MRRMLVLGAAGMAGHVVSDYFSEQPDWTLIRSARTQVTPDTVILDVEDLSLAESRIREIRPDVVVNCIGVLVRESEEEPVRAVLLNSYLPHLLARLGCELGFRLVHLSTDCVFSGKAGGYEEGAFRDGDTFYARSKALGEVDSNGHLTIRTSIIGPELKTNGTGLLHWFLNQTGRIVGYKRVYWSGVTTRVLAESIRVLLEQEATGLIHLTMPERISKFDLLRLFAEVWERTDLVIDEDAGHVSDKSLVSTRRDIHLPIPSSYASMLRDLRAYMDIHPDWYAHYRA